MPMSKMKPSQHPTATKPLDDYEKELADFLEKGEYVSDPNFAETKAMIEEAAKRNLSSTSD